MTFVSSIFYLFALSALQTINTDFNQIHHQQANGAPRDVYYI